MARSGIMDFVTGFTIGDTFYLWKRTLFNLMIALANKKPISNYVCLMCLDNRLDELKGVLI